MTCPTTQPQYIYIYTIDEDLEYNACKATTIRLLGASGNLRRGHRTTVEGCWPAIGSARVTGNQILIYGSARGCNIVRIGWEILRTLRKFLYRLELVVLPSRYHFHSPWIVRGGMDLASGDHN